MRYTISLDVHRRETQACVADEDGDVVAEKRFRTSETSYRRALRKYEDGEVVFEAVGFYRPVARWLDAMGYDVHLAHVGRVPKSRQKTDKKDARRLLTLWRGDALPEAYLPPEEVQRLRDLARHRQFLGQESRRLKGKLKQDLYKHGHFVDENPVETEKGRAWLRTLEVPEIRSTLHLWERLKEEIDAFQARIESETTDLPEALLLMTVPGIGAYTALLVLAEVGDFSRVPTGDRLAAYAGLVPSHHQSGDAERMGSITKEGNPTLRWALVEAARNHVRLCPDSSISRRYVRLAQTKGHGRAITAAARHLCTVLWSMMARKEVFQVNP
jgi:transposase